MHDRIESPDPNPLLRARSTQPPQLQWALPSRQLDQRECLSTPLVSRVGLDRRAELGVRGGVQSWLGGVACCLAAAYFVRFPYGKDRKPVSAPDIA